MNTLSSFSFTRIGASEYEVRLPGTSTLLGIVKRGPHGWNGWTPEGRQVVSDYPGSRDTAAGNIVRAKS
jgi:hypothetical protein